MFPRPAEDSSPSARRPLPITSETTDGGVLRRHEAAPGRCGQIPLISLMPIACEAIPATSW